MPLLLTGFESLAEIGVKYVVGWCWGWAVVSECRVLRSETKLNQAKRSVLRSETKLNSNGANQCERGGSCMLQEPHGEYQHQLAGIGF